MNMYEFKLNAILKNKNTIMYHSYESNDIMIPKLKIVAKFPYHI